LERWTAEDKNAVRGDHEEQKKEEPSKKVEKPANSPSDGKIEKAKESIAPVEVKPKLVQSTTKKEEATTNSRFENVPSESQAPEEVKYQVKEEVAAPIQPKVSYGRGRGRGSAPTGKGMVSKAPAPDFQTSPIAKKEASPPASQAASNASNPPTKVVAELANSPTEPPAAQE